ncbi:MAG: hypothetical protein A3C85_02345 [Candidatus Doudnabacteria bacterium RIFCSPHIGHO2_02_FULL_48_21]|nr:MAG: hypothetical protein A3K05_04545 [Candidatus Doudnabacteria bacterium RIFCSPHIGHO2_01_48_18]OGE79948.1 MAG: hypothetical protein A2668_01935 [Candidatus Doudnabacteria bacterium RIFCSPHIGHO2_01_FULL_48_180]OGE90965.1 MAG: hypothetical protein A3F44_02610 [Candidatus Doudnabacteria bacterium RIFCSPHIGHO2_12_FULL_47_25]OGE93462.1 MAG: hypothetical protein A3C85_02345 [Candidatus Doudnabacteria bacterium RIFCSPHIGHO2_02_FULL_48_21]OGE96297.1 MAG: hypothetical protein A3A83_04745 [Candidatu
MNKTNLSAGFTIIELLVVISIIALLASVILVSLNSARAKARNAKRVSDLLQIQTALELYYDDNNRYPVSGGWRSQCAGWGSLAQNLVVYDPAAAKGIVPAYMAWLPADPSMNAAANTACYIYNSDGVNYKFLDRGIDDMTLADVNGQFLKFKDPARNDQASLPPCNVPDPNISISVWNTSGAMCW